MRQGLAISKLDNRCRGSRRGYADGTWSSGHYGSPICCSVMFETIGSQMRLSDAAQATGRYILHISVIAEFNDSALATSTVCLQLTAANITIWWDSKAARNSFSDLKGVFGSVTGLTRWQRQYSLTREIILPACSSLAVTQR